MSDQVIRFYHIINLLPRHSAMTLTIPKLQDMLLDKGYAVGQRTLQRDMNALESIFAGIACKKLSDRSVCWFWTEDAPAHISKLTLKQEWGDSSHPSFNYGKSSNENNYYKVA